MKKTNSEKGITLVALIITIIVLLILAVVTIRAVQGDGIIRYAQNAKDEYTQKANEEKWTLKEYEDRITEELTGVNPGLLNHAGKIPEGATYYRAGTKKICDECGTEIAAFSDSSSDVCQVCLNIACCQSVEKTAVSEFPDEPIKGDRYRYGDYEYQYGASMCAFNNCWGYACSHTRTIDGWAVKCINGNVEVPGTILESINGKPVVDMTRAFFNNVKITKAPAIPNTVTNMDEAFSGCSNLTTAPTIPSSVTNAVELFSFCTKLTGTITINTNASLTVPFNGIDFETQQLTLAGSSTKLDEYGATGTNYCNECNGYCKGTH